MPSPTSKKQLKEQPCKHFAIVIMRRPHRAAVGVLSPRRAPKLGKIRRRACLCLIPFPGTGDVLLAPTMISHPLAYVAPNPRHLAPTVGPGAPPSRDLFWTGTLFLPGERSQPGTPDGVCADALHGAEIACAASCLADLVGEVCLSDEPASNAGMGGPESLLAGLRDQIHGAGEPAADLESIGSTDPMLVDSDTASLDAFPTNVVVYDEPLSYAGSGGSAVTEVLVLEHGERSSEGAHDPFDAALRDLAAPIPEDTDAGTLEALRLQLIEGAKKLASMRRLSEAYQREMDHAVGGSPAPTGPSRLGAVRQRGAAIANLFGADRPVYATPAENIRAAQAAADELDNFEGEERRIMTERVQQLLDAAAAQNDAGCRTEAPQRQNDDPPPRRDQGATSRTPTGGARGKKDKEPAVSHSRTHITIERDQDGRPKAVERWDDYLPPPPRRERRVSPPPVEHPTHGNRLGRREGVGENDARHRIDRLHRSLALEEKDELGPPCFGPRIRDEPFPKGFTLPRDTPKYTGTVKPEDWLIDYSTAVNIANGNKRVAVRYVPLMLQGSARTWLNSLKPRSINSWVDFTEAFVRNFTSTYKRPPKPRQLSLCVQGPDESTRDYLTRWGELRNSCEGVHEVQAIEYFTAGCREGTLLKHKLLCDEPETLDELLITADKYATADSSMKAEIRVSTTGKVAPQAPRTPAGDTSRRQQQNDQKRKAPQPTSSSRQVATAEDQQLEGPPPAKRQKGGKSNWLPAFSYEQTLDGPCKFHSGAKPSNHTTRKCHWLTRIAKGDGLLPPAPAGPPPPPPPQQPAVRPVGAIQDEFPDEHVAYVVFNSVADDRRSRRQQ